MEKGAYPQEEEYDIIFFFSKNTYLIPVSNHMNTFFVFAYFYFIIINQLFCVCEVRIEKSFIKQKKYVKEIYK